jgi:type I restriction-modification system DNA methylase subunit
LRGRLAHSRRLYALKTFDYVVANPPFSDKRWNTGFDTHGFGSRKAPSGHRDHV